MKYLYNETDTKKIFHSETFNCVFNKETGDCVTWGKTIDDDEDFSWAGNLVTDIEVSTVCYGLNGKLCPMCYKSNTPQGINMSFNEFKKIADLLPKFTQQIAFGVSSCGETNPDLWKMMDYCREIGIVPNLTVADISDETADKISDKCGAVAISHYDNKNICYDNVKKLTDRGMKQVNQHFCLYEDTYERALEVIDDMKTDPRLKDMNAIVFLSLKNKGRGKQLKRITQKQFDVLIKKCIDNEIKFGADSCSGKKMISSLTTLNKENLIPMITGCESLKLSLYINAKGEAYPCSFCEGEQGYEEGIDMLKINDISDVWYHEKTKKFREKVTGTCHAECPVFDV